MSTAIEIGERVAQARREKGVRERRDITQREVAKDIGVSPTTISDCESGKQIPGERVIQSLARYLGVTPAFLRYGVGETKTPTEEVSAMDFIPDPLRDRPISAAEIARARAVRDAEQAETTGTRTPKVRKATGGRKRG